MRPHCLRHSRATHLKEAGIDIKDIIKNIIDNSVIYTQYGKITVSLREYNNKISNNIVIVIIFIINNIDEKTISILLTISIFKVTAKTFY